MQNIDLSLAINYLPACGCVMRLLAYLMWRTAMLSYHDMRTYVVIGVLLYLDRAFQGKVTFFDSNALLLCVYFADIYQHIRHSSDDVLLSVLFAYFFWCFSACFYLLDHDLPFRLPLSMKTIQICTSCILVLFLLFHTAQAEHHLCDVAKAFMFIFLCITWIYLVGLKNIPVINHSFVVRFIPILIVPIWMSILVSIVSLCIMICHYRHTFTYSCSKLSSSDHTVNNSNNNNNNNNNTNKSHKQPLVNSMPSIAEDDDVEAMFHLAKAQQHQGPPAFTYDRE